LAEAYALLSAILVFGTEIKGSRDWPVPG